MAFPAVMEAGFRGFFFALMTLLKEVRAEKRGARKLALLRNVRLTDWSWSVARIGHLDVHWAVLYPREIFFRIGGRFGYWITVKILDGAEVPLFFAGVGISGDAGVAALADLVSECVDRWNDRAAHVAAAAIQRAYRHARWNPYTPLGFRQAMDLYRDMI